MRKQLAVKICTVHIKHYKQTNQKIIIINTITPILKEINTVSRSNFQEKRKQEMKTPKKQLKPDKRQTGKGIDPLITRRKLGDEAMYLHIRTQDA